MSSKQCLQDHRECRPVRPDLPYCNADGKNWGRYFGGRAGVTVWRPGRNIPADSRLQGRHPIKPPIPSPGRFHIFHGTKYKATEEVKSMGR